jgi:hypothetical protein
MSVTILKHERWQPPPVTSTTQAHEVIWYHFRLTPRYPLTRLTIWQHRRRLRWR